MTRYFFHFHECGTVTADEEGRELSDVSCVRSAAIREARQLMSAEVKGGKLCLSCHIEVVDQNQRPVLIMPFKEAIRLTGL